MITAFIAFVKSLSWQTYLIVALAVAGAAVYAEKTGHIVLLEHELAGVTKDKNALQLQISEAKELAAKTQAEYETKARQTAAEQKEASDEAQRMVIRARDDSSSATTALGKLLQRAVASSGQTPSHPQVAGASTTAEGPGLRTDLLGSVGAEAVRYAAIADAARIAGQACEADYNAVAQPYGDD